MVTVDEARNEVASHCALSWPIPKAPIMSGIATLIMVLAISAATLAKVIVAIATQPNQMP